MGPQSNNNNFFGIKVSQPGINVNNASPSQLIYSNDYSTETFNTTSGSMSFGLLANGGLGMQITDDNGNVIFELNGQTWYWYDPKNGYVNNMQVGLLPDGSYGWAVATPGNSVASAF